MKILLVQTGFLGDAILSTAVIPNLRVLYPTAVLDVLTTPLAREIFDSNPNVSEVFGFDKRSSQSGFSGLKEMARILKARRYDMAFSLHKSWRTAILLYMTRIRARYGFREASGSWLYRATANRSDLPHEVLRNLAILRTVGLEPEDAIQELELTPPAAAFEMADQLLAPLGGRRLIGIAPASVWATKQWKLSGFAEVAQHFRAHDYGIVLIGSSADAAHASAIIREVGSGQLVNTVGETTPIAAAALISRLDLLVSNDSAPLHMASAVGTPVVAVFCATIPEFGFGPWRVPSAAIGVPSLSCRPCGRHGGSICPIGTLDCSEQLDPSWVIHAAEALIGKGERQYIS